MFCAKCGEEVNNNATACPKCGAPVASKKGAGGSPVAVPNHMVGAVLSSLFCCLIGGIVSIVYASKVNTKLAQGDVVGAKLASRSAKNWIIANVIFGLLVGLVYFFGIAPLVSRTMNKANAAAASMRGRNLYVGILQANMNRMDKGLPDVWPRTAGSTKLSDDKKDIAGMTFENSTDYFRTLFAKPAYGTADWEPYVSLDASVLKFSETSKNKFCDWIVAANVTDDMDDVDVIPVLVSANVDPTYLKTSFDGNDNTPIPFGSKVGRKQIPWGDDFVVVVRKGGATSVIEKKYFNYSLLYNKRSFSAPGLKYLDVK